ncbi:hypothetical protein AGMMS50256_20490 [Betaproteobacteria bacterium]|nr:hypothetical protein AGMMS50256_20490 [Betaproteobacteria bacterium]
MALELIVNVLFAIAAMYTYWYVGETMPESDASELGAEQWPQFLIVLLLIAIAFNIRGYFKRNKKEDITAAFADFVPSVGRLLTSKLFIGMILLIAMAYLYDILGFIATCPLFMIGYGLILGGRPVTVIVSAVIITFVLYIGFSVFLDVMLPRGDVPFLRSFALFVESLFE